MESRPEQGIEYDPQQAGVSNPEINLMTDAEVEKQQKEAQEHLDKQTHEKAMFDQRCKKMASTFELMKSWQKTWDDEWLSQQPARILRTNLESVQSTELQFLKEYWAAFPTLDQNNKEAGERKRTQLEMWAETLILKIHNHITLREKQEQEREALEDKEAITRAQLMATEEAVKKAAAEKEEQEIYLFNKTQEVEALKVQRDAEIARINQQLSAETQRLYEATLRIQNLEKTTAQTSAAKEALKNQLNQLRIERDDATYKYQKMLKEDKKEDEEHEKAINLKQRELVELQEKHQQAKNALAQREAEIIQHKEKFSHCEEPLKEVITKEKALRDDLEKELSLLQKERELDAEHCEFQIRLHETLVQQLKRLSQTNPIERTHQEPYADLMFGDEPEVPSPPIVGTIGVSTSITRRDVEEVLKLEADLKTVRDLTNFDFLEDATRTQLMERKEYIGKLERDFNKGYERIAPSTEVKSNRGKWLGIRTGFLAIVKELDKKINARVAKIDEQINSPRRNRQVPDPPVVTVRTVEPTVGTASPRQVQSGVSVDYRLERIELGNFNGNLTEWNSWKEVFLVLVHNSATIPAIMKFHQLRSHLKGPALETISGYQLTANNYLPAWEDLKARYDRKDNIVHEYIKKFIEVPILNIHSPYQKIFTVINGTKQMLRALPGLDVNVAQWDPFILFILLSKLDEETRRTWKNLVGRRENATVAELLEFLETKAIESQPSMSEHMYNMLSGKKMTMARSNAPKIFYTEGAGTSEAGTSAGTTGSKNSFPKQPGNQNWQQFDSNKCPKCRGSHRLTWCDAFKRMKPEERKAFVKRHRFCYKCLEPHLFKHCKERNCSNCSGTHHRLICPDKPSAKVWAKPPPKN